MNLHLLAIRLLLDPLLQPFWEEVELTIDFPSVKIQQNNHIYLYFHDNIPCFSITGHNAKHLVRYYTPIIEKYSLRFISLESQASICF